MTYTIDGTTYQGDGDVAEAFGMNDYRDEELAAVAALTDDELIADCHRIRAEWHIVPADAEPDENDEIAAEAIRAYLNDRLAAN